MIKKQTIQALHRSQVGYSLMEALIAIAISSALLAVVVNVFTTQRNLYSTQDQIAMMLQNAMAGLELMKREIMIAGYDPTTLAGAGIVAADVSSIRFTMDVTDGADSPGGGGSDDDDDDDDGDDDDDDEGKAGGGGGVTAGEGSGDYDGPDGDIADIGEDVIYTLVDLDNDGKQELVRDAGEGDQVVAENIESLAFAYTLSDGTVTGDPTAAELDQIRLIEITLTARTAKPDPKYPHNGGYRTYTLRQAIHIRNL